MGVKNSLFQTSISKSDWQSLQKFNSAIKVTNDGLTKSQRITKAWNENMTDCSMVAKRMGNDLITGKKKIGDISNSMKTATASTKALNTAMNVFANVGFMLAITAVTKAVTELAQAQSKAVEVAQEATEAYKDELSSLEEYKEKVSELHKELNSENISYEDSKTIREELLILQDELIKKYGNEKTAIENITTAIKGEVDALDELNEKAYRDWVAKADETTWWNLSGKSGLDQAIDYMETDQTVSFHDMQNANLSEELQKIQKEIDEIIKSKYNLDKTFATFNVTGTPEEIKSQLESIRQDYIDLSKDAFLKNGISSEMWEEYRKEAIDSLNKVINKFDDGLKKHQETYQTYIEGMIKYDSEYSDEYAIILQKRAELESAQNSGNKEEIQKARQAFMDAISKGIEESNSNENIRKYFESLYPELQSEFSSWNFEISLNANLDGLTDIANEIGEKYTAVDLLKMVDNDSAIIADKTFNSLIDKAIEYGICVDKSSEEVQKLIDLLIELGYVQDKSGTYTPDADKTSLLTPEQLESIETYKKNIESVQKILEKIRDTSPEAKKVLVDEIYETFGDSGIDLDSLLADAFERNGQVNESDMMAIADAIWDSLVGAMGNSKEAQGIIQAIREKYADFNFDQVIDVNKNAYKELYDLYKQINSGKTFSQEELKPYLSTYEDLNGAVLKVGDAYSLQEDAIVSLINKYGELTNVAITSEMSIIEARLKNNTYGALSIAELQERINAYNSSGSHSVHDIPYITALQDALKDKQEYEELLGLFDEIISTSTKNANKTSVSKFEESIDWASHSISVLEDKVSDLERILENTKGWEGQVEVIGKLNDALSDLKSGYENSAAIYDSEYEKLLTTGIIAEQGLTDILRKSIENGERFDIEPYIDASEDGIREELYDAVNKAIDNYNKSSDAQNKALEIEFKIDDNDLARLNLILDKVNDKIKDLNKQLDSIDDKIGGLDSLFSGAVAYIQQEIDAQEEVKNGLQEQLEALQDANDERQRSLALEKAKYELERAQSQRVKKVYKGEGQGFVYEQDHDAVRSAQENLANLEYEDTVRQLEKQIEYYDEIIAGLQEVQDSWSNIASKAQDFLDIQYALTILGKDGIFDADKIEKFSKQYSKLLKTKNSQEENIEEFENLSSIFEDLISSFEDGEITYEQCLVDMKQSAISFKEETGADITAVKTLLNNAMTELAKVQSDKTIENKAKSTAEDVTDTLRTETDEQKEILNGLVSNIGGSFQSMCDNAKLSATTTFEELGDSVTNIAEDIKKDIDALIDEATEKLEKLKELKKETEKTTSGIKDSSVGVGAIGFVSGVIINSDSEYHTGLEKGYVGDAMSDGKRLQILQKAGRGELDYNEIPTILQKGEVVLTKMQQINIADSLLQKSIVPNINIPDYSHLSNIVQRNPQVSFGDININCPGITSQQVANQVGVELQKQFGNMKLDALQISGRRR